MADTRDLITNEEPETIKFSYVGENIIFIPIFNSNIDQL